MSSFVRHESCPKCRKEGKDRGSNNLGVYLDGSVYCFSCGYYRPGNGLSKLRQTNADHACGTTSNAKIIHLPADSELALPGIARDYLAKYALTQKDINVNRLMWSEATQRLIFPIFGEKELLAYQGRYLKDDNKRAKWYSMGDLKNIYHIIGNKTTHKLILTEDIISAIRVGNNPNLSAMPLFGSHISIERLLQIKKMYGTIYMLVWLDKDKQKEAIKFTQQANSIGIDAGTIITDKDPKEYTDKEIDDFTNP